MNCISEIFHELLNKLGKHVEVVGSLQARCQTGLILFKNEKNGELEFKGITKPAKPFVTSVCISFSTD